MTDLAYMLREDWAQDGEGMASQSAVIRTWLDGAPTVLAVGDVKKHNLNDHSADVEAAAYVFPGDHHLRVVSISALARTLRSCESVPSAAAILHPYRPQDLQCIAQIVAGDKLQRAFVLVWASEDTIRWWLEGVRATNLHSGRPARPADPLMVEAARMMVDETYNGLGSGRGKDVVVGLVRLFADRGYAACEWSWLRAYFAAGGDFRHAETVRKLVSEIRCGKQHQVQKFLTHSVFGLLEERAAALNY